MAKSPIIGFYHPHERVQFHNEIFDPKTGEVTNPPSMTKQEFQRECDINNIVRDFQVTGMFNHVNTRANQGAYLDLPSDMDFQSSVDVVAKAREAFMSLPSKIRDRFNNDPTNFLNFMGDSENLKEAQELGLIPKPRAEPPAPAPAPAAPAPEATPPQPKA